MAAWCNVVATPCQHALLQPPVVWPGLHRPWLLPVLCLALTAAAAGGGGGTRAPPSLLLLPLLLLVAVVTPPAPATAGTLRRTPVVTHNTKST
jgi:hypothetical protein